MNQSMHQTPNVPYLTPSQSPRELTPDPSTGPDLLGDCYDDRAFAQQTRSPPSSSAASSLRSFASRIKAPVSMHSARPSSVAAMNVANRPTLQDILQNAAPPPYTRGAFMAFLSQNHCLETLEFTMEAERYQNTYAQIQMDEGQNPALWPQDAQDYAFLMWRKLIHNYILPCGPREVNLPGRVRDRLLRLDCSPTAPHPAELDEAVRIVYELMNDSVLLTFFDSLQQQQEQYQEQQYQDQYYYAQQPDYDEVDVPQHHDARQSRSRLRIPADAASSSGGSGNESSRSPKSSFFPQLAISRHGRSPSASSAAASRTSDRMGLSDDSGTSTPPPGEPITPPTTPPTSDWNFSTSPNGLQRAITGHNAGWKRMSQKLGLGGLKSKTRSSRRSNNTSSGSNDCAESPTSAEGAEADYYGQAL